MTSESLSQNEKIAPNTASDRLPSPGYLLGERRQQVGWSEKDVAQNLRLSTNQIIAIEADDFDQLPGITYVLGYWRSYAQLLKINIDEAIDQYRNTASLNKRVVTAPRTEARIHGHDEKSRKKAAIGFGLVLIGFLVAIWYWQSPNSELMDWRRFGVSLNESDDLNRSTDVVASTNGATTNQQTSQGSGEAELAIPIPNFSNDQETTEINTRGYEVLIQELPLSARKLVFKSPVVEDVIEVVDAIVQAAEPVAIVEVIPEVIPTTPEITSNEISFVVEKESWIDVRDADGVRLIYRTVLAGEDIRLEGVPPYAVFIGSAEGVKINFKNKEVPFSLDESGSFARFDVGTE